MSRPFAIVAVCGLAGLGLVVLLLLAEGGGGPVLNDAVDDEAAASETTPMNGAASNVEAVDAAADASSALAPVNLSDTECIAALEAALPPSSIDSMSQAEHDAAMETFEAARASLAASTNPEHRLAAVLSGEVDSRATLFGQMAVPESSNPLVLWHNLLLCRRTEREDCPVGDLEARLLAADPANGEAWMHVAVGRYARGDRAGALAAMQQAGAAAESRAYWFETIDLIDRALVATAGFDHYVRFGFGVGAAASTLPDWPSGICREESAESVDWAQACAEYGALTELRNDTVIGQMIAAGIRIQAVRNLGYEEQAAELEAVSDAREPQLTRLSSVVGLMVASDSAYFSRYFEMQRVGGEQEVMERFLRAELPPLFERLGTPAACTGAILGGQP